MPLRCHRYRGGGSLGFGSGASESTVTHFGEPTTGSLGPVPTIIALLEENLRPRSLAMIARLTTRRCRTGRRSLFPLGALDPPPRFTRRLRVPDPHTSLPQSSGRIGDRVTTLEMISRAQGPLWRRSTSITEHKGSKPNVRRSAQIRWLGGGL